jgi:hypothetical protein
LSRRSLCSPLLSQPNHATRSAARATRLAGYDLRKQEYVDTVPAEVATSPENSQLFDAAGRKVGGGLHVDFWQACVEGVDDVARIRHAKIEVAVLWSDPGVVDPDRWYADLLDHGKRNGERLAPKTVRNVAMMVRAALKSAPRKGIITHNVSEDSDIPTRTRPVMKIWTVEESACFLDAMSDEAVRDRPIRSHNRSPTFGTPGSAVVAHRS